MHAVLTGFGWSRGVGGEPVVEILDETVTDFYGQQSQCFQLANECYLKDRITISAYSLCSKIGVQWQSHADFLRPGKPYPILDRELKKYMCFKFV